MSEQSRDWRLDVPLRTACAQDIQEICLFEREKAGLLPSAAVLECLQEFRHELRSKKCAEAVHRTIERASDDTRFSPILQHACWADYMNHCQQVVRHFPPYIAIQSVRSFPLR
jgi:hypothetical protein